VTYTDSDLSELLAAVQGGEMTEKIRTSLTYVPVPGGFWVFQTVRGCRMTPPSAVPEHAYSASTLSADPRRDHRARTSWTAQSGGDSLAGHA
jgi:hypothetical protein